MCSPNDDIYDDKNEINKNAKDSFDSTNTSLCKKCRNENIDMVLTGQSGYCKTCFITITNHKFRATLGKSKIICHSDLILVDHLGKLNSTVLLHLIKSSMNESAHKKLIFKTIVLYIDDGTMMGRTIDERNVLRYKIAKEIKDFGFNGYIISLNQVLNKKNILDIKPIDQEIHHEYEDHLCTILDNLSDITSRTDLLNQLHRRLLILTAQKLNCNKVFVSDSAMDIATRVMGDICLGRGAQLSTLVNFCDTRYVDIKILKPLRNFTQQELIYYSEHYKIKSIKLGEFNTPATSIQVLVRNFVDKLESQFPGTVSTIFHTAEKIRPKNNALQNAKDNCMLCDVKLDAISSSNEISALRAIEISKQISSNIETRTSNNGNEEPVLCLDDKIYCNDNIECGCKNINKKITAEDVWRYLCYSCRLSFQNSEILSILPMPLLFAIQQRLALKNMKKEINEFLL